MSQLPGFQLSENLHRGISSLVYRARRESDGESIILKMLGDTYPSPERIAWFQREFETTRALAQVDGVIRAHEILRVEQRWILVLEDFGGVALARLANERRFTLDEVVELGLRIVEVLEGVHARHVIHKDLNPTNLVFNPATRQLKLIDFGISSVLSRESPTLREPLRLEGTLAYISPEQTGRMNRAIDYRTDFYSLGVVLYELATGQLPFTSGDPLELVHAHIARQPVPPHELAGVDRPLSDIILRLLAKNAEDRYQSAHGLRRDLEEYRLRRSQGKLEPFALGHEDVSDRFQIPQKLYGRERETRQLLEAFDQMVSGGSEVVLLSGYSGIGKSALVRELHRPLTRQQGYFTAGKCDQLVRDEPYAPVLQALRSLARHLLSESDERLAQWRDKLGSALGSNGRLVTDIIPELESLLGPQPLPPELPFNEEKHRFLLTLKALISVFGTREHPLVLFIDDLQWVDEPSLELLQLLSTGGGQHRLLLIGAYRDNEVGDTHPVALALGQLRKAGVAIRELPLQPLDVEHVGQLVSEALAREPRETEALTRLVHAKTGGNPFFLGEFLKHLNAEGLLRFKPGHGWRWDEDRIAARRETDNVVELMAGKVRKLSERAMRVLQLAACVGNSFDLRTLAVVSERPPQDVATDLWAALDEGLVLPLDEKYRLTGVEVTGLFDAVNVEYRFSHDRVQQAAYSTLDEDERRRAHWRVGGLLWKSTPADTLSQRIFDIVTQLQHGLGYAADRGERDALARLFLLSGRRAKASGAYAPALQYLRLGLWLLAEPRAGLPAGFPPEQEVAESWRREYRLTLELFDEAAEAACLCGEYEHMRALLALVHARASTLLDKIRSYKTEIQSYAARERLLDGVNVGRLALEQLGIVIPENPDMDAIVRTATEAASTWAGRDIEGLGELPEMTDPEKLAAMEIMARLYIPAFNGAPNVFALVVFHEIILSVRYGLAPNSSRGLVAYGFLLCTQGQVEPGYRFGKLALRVTERFARRDLSSAVFMFNFFVRHWRDSVRDPLEPFLDGYRLALESGDLEFAGLNLVGASAQALWSGRELPKVAAEAASYDLTLHQLRQELPRETNGVHRQMALNLLGKSADPLMLVGETYDERVKLPFYAKVNNVTLLAITHTCKLALCFLFGEHERALEHAREVEKLLPAMPMPILLPSFRFYAALSHLARHRGDGDGTHAAALEQVDAHLEVLRSWAVHSPVNVEHKVVLVEAERARVLGRAAEARDLYDRAISLAQKHELLHEEAVAHELAARFHRERGHAHLTRHYLRDAHYAYRRWGAMAKVKQLEARFPQELAQPAPSNKQTIPTEGTTSQQFVNPQALDLLSVLKASRALSGEIVLDKLLARLLTTVLENAGAQKALLLLEKDGGFIIEAEGSVEGGMSVLQSRPVSGEDDLPLALLNLVARSGKPEVVPDAAAEGMLVNEPYVQRTRPKSVLCMPLINQGKLTAILYLENNLLAGAFTQERTELLTLLSGEMAIAIDHARLYRALQLANRELADYSHTLEHKVALRTRELGDKNRELEQTLVQLREAQRMLVLREKMASLGRVTAGIAHEIRNPLNFIINFAELSRQVSQDIVSEMAELGSTPSSERLDEMRELVTSLGEYIARIEDHGRRANGIISAMMAHSRSSNEKRLPLDVNVLLREALKLSYHATRSQDPRFSTELDESYEAAVGAIDAVPHELSRVIINMVENACYSTRQKQQRQGGANYTPKIWVTTMARNNSIEIRIRDNGLGISPEHLDNIFQPFFTTKPTGEGTGLGLSICYDIVVHKYRGNIRVDTNAGEYAEFTIVLPRGVATAA